MKRTLYPILFLALACAPSPRVPAERALALGSQLRCPVCRGVPISESPSTLAQEMMGEVRGQIQAGRSDEEILKFFQERYGEWVLLKPRAEGMNLVVWIFPLLFLLLGGWFIRRQVK